ncbi:ATP-dependent RNA helicase HrpA [Pelagibaculum spongiae]|uniref:ATP-dependent RNA helicase HrpA n=1 Tax=Pelagibaculum spongiae TaxID=2080658 RepID=A0A2V1GNT0_9GAMM|nr:ATP-dependent RNA helicase HrpA [Pelagibaculum spongiae]PVZ64322.1 ATP-dependent RNA helicase HrpA [Pelagibaculum spongiae]
MFFDTWAVLKSRLHHLRQQLSQCLTEDDWTLRRRLRSLKRRIEQNQPVDKALSDVERQIEKSKATLIERKLSVPKINFSDQLPVCQNKDEIAKAIQDHQVVVLAGETGSGKTTQLPKICLELGLGVRGMIGHTQPRRLAARTVAKRIAEELNSALGTAVGFKIRFNDQVGKNSYIKLMTDGILLSEMQRDPLLSQYEVIIIDEAHERSLNIDFLMGYLKQLLPKRPDLKIIITSATIDPARFARHFDHAPVLEISGRTFPVETRYRPLLIENGSGSASGESSESGKGSNDKNKSIDLDQAVVDAVDELSRESRGDILVFLPGERDIREISEALRKQNYPNTEVLPLFSRLSSSEQDRIFQNQKFRKIVLATNVAETSVTVPGIRYVIDSGLARISRYSYRTKVQRLPIEAISQASASQRQGRCGRLSDGICIRLFSEEDFLNRAEFTEPEILRTNLASVILQMSQLRLGDVEKFPFVDAPDARFVRDGYRLLEELSAMEDGRLTDTGKKMARLPLDPQLARMLISGGSLGCLSELLPIVCGLSIQDPRERPQEATAQADQKQSEFKDPDSDFASLLNLWNFTREKRKELTGNQFKKVCKEYYLAYMRVREWWDIHHQLKEQLLEMKLTFNTEPADYEKIHKALLSGFISHIGYLDEDKTYLGARNSRFEIFPGSGIKKKKPKWLFAAEIVETSKVFARCCAKVEPQWIEQLAGDQLKRSYNEPYYDLRRGEVMASEKVTLYGLTVVSARKVRYSMHHPALCREIMLRQGMAVGKFKSTAPFWAHNQRLIAEIKELEEKQRRQDLLVDDEDIFFFYDQNIPADVVDQRGIENWLKKTADKQPKALFMEKEQLLRSNASIAGEQQFPSSLAIGNHKLQLKYLFEPGREHDGVNAIVPLSVLPDLPAAPFEWLVPGLIREKLIALIRGLPKPVRKNFVPAPMWADTLMEQLDFRQGSLIPAVTSALLRKSAIMVEPENWNFTNLDPHLTFCFRVIDGKGKILEVGRDLTALQAMFKDQAKQAAEETSKDLPSTMVKWQCGEVPEVLDQDLPGQPLRVFPALISDTGAKSVSLKYFATKEDAQQSHKEAVITLCVQQAPDQMKWLITRAKGINKLQLLFSALGNGSELNKQLTRSSVERCLGETLPRTPAQYDALLLDIKQNVCDRGEQLIQQLIDILLLWQKNQKLSRKVNNLLLMESLKNIQDHLSSLVYPGFLLEIPEQWLEQYPRYLKALAARLERLPREVSRDRERYLDVENWLEKYRQALKIYTPDQLEEFRWMLEEYRVSLFAQELKTIKPISAPRLQKIWQAVHAQ